MKRWLISFGLALIASCASAQILGGYTETRSFGIWAANLYNNPNGDRGNDYEQGPFSFRYSPGPFHEVNAAQNLDIVGPIGTFSAGKIRWTLDSTATDSSADSDIASGVEFDNFSFNPFPDLSISARVLATSTSVTFSSGEFHASESTYVSGLTIKAFGHVVRYNGTISPDTLLWSGNGISIYGNVIESVNVYDGGADVSIYGLYINYYDLDLGGGNDFGYSYFGGARSTLGDPPSAHRVSGRKRGI